MKKILILLFCLPLFAKAQVPTLSLDTTYKAKANETGVLKVNDAGYFLKLANLDTTIFAQFDQYGKLIQRKIVINSAGNQPITVSVTGDATGTSVASTAPSVPLTLATVNANVGSFTNANITLDAKGRVIAASNGSAGGGATTASNGLTKTVDNIKLGGTLTENTTIYSGGNTFKITKNAPDSSVNYFAYESETINPRLLTYAKNSNNQLGIFSFNGNNFRTQQQSGLVGVTGTNYVTTIDARVVGGSGFGKIWDSSTVYLEAAKSIPNYLNSNSSIEINALFTTTRSDSAFNIVNKNIRNNANNTVIPVLNIIRRHGNGLVGLSGIGGSVDFILPSNNSGTEELVASNKIISKLTDVVNGTRSSEFSITGVNNADETTLLKISGAGIFTLVNGLGNFADDAAAATGGIPVNGLYRTGSIIKIRVL